MFIEICILQVDPSLRPHDHRHIQSAFQLSSKAANGRNQFTNTPGKPSFTSQNSKKNHCCSERATCRIIASVLQPLEPFDKGLQDVPSCPGNMVVQVSKDACTGKKSIMLGQNHSWGNSVCTSAQHVHWVKPSTSLCTENPLQADTTTSAALPYPTWGPMEKSH